MNKLLILATIFLTFILTALILSISNAKGDIPIKDTKGVEIFDNVKHFSFEGHKYIKFSDGNLCGVVHDPKCGCKKY